MKKFLALAGIAIIFAACNKNEGPEAPIVDDMIDTPIMVSAGVADMTTRAGHDAGTLTTGVMGFFMTTEGTDGDTKYNTSNKKMVYNDGKGWMPQDGTSLLWKNKTAKVDYIAYHPYDVMADNGICPINVTKEQTSVDVIDLLYAEGSTTCDISKGSIDLAMKHAMTRLTVTLRPGTELGETPEFKSVVLKDMAERANFDLERGPVWSYYAAYTSCNITMIQNENLSYEAIVIPQEFKDSEFVVEIITADNRKFVFRQNNVTLSMGMAYTLNLIVGKDKVELDNAGITAEDWGTPDNWNGSFETE